MFLDSSKYLPHTGKRFSTCRLFEYGTGLSFITEIKVRSTQIKSRTTGLIEYMCKPLD